MLHDPMRKVALCAYRDFLDGAELCPDSAMRFLYPYAKILKTPPPWPGSGSIPLGTDCGAAFGPCTADHHHKDETCGLVVLAVHRGVDLGVKLSDNWWVDRGA